MGTDFFARYVERMTDLAAAFADTVEARPGWELAVRPEGNIVCFRYAPEGMEDADGLQSRVRDAVVRSGAYHIVKTVLRGKTWLRVTVMNPLTTQDDLTALLGLVEATARACQAAPEGLNPARRTPCPPCPASRPAFAPWP